MTTTNDQQQSAQSAPMGSWERRRQLLSTPDAARLLSITDDQFRRMMDRLGIEPEDWFKNPHYRSGPMCPLWPPESVRALVGSPEVAAARARRQALREARRVKPKLRRRLFATRFPVWSDAMPAAAEAMFALNRYAKHSTCSDANRKEIYVLKNGFVRMLCALGMATEVKHHVVTLSALTCLRCKGTGESEDDCNRDDDDDDDGECDDAPGTCPRCHGTGQYKPPKDIVNVAFRFAIGDRHYAWHQPRELVNWDYHVTDAPTAWDVESAAKPVPPPSRRFADAKSLVRWVLGQSREAVVGHAQSSGVAAPKIAKIADEIHGDLGDV